MAQSLPDLISPFRVLGSAVLDWVLPPRCAGCGAITGAGAGFCADCFGQLHIIGPPACARCDRPFAQAQGDGALCGACLADPPRWQRTRAALAYGPLPRAVVLKLKYGRRVALAQLAARLMAPRLPARDPDAVPHDWRLVPVPLHRWRLWQRGFNQSAEIARALAKTSGQAMIPDLLLRTRATPTLRGLGRKARASAVRGAFTVNPRHAPVLKDAHILLIDDVLTSGATADACTAALLKGGAARVELLVFARVLSEAEEQWAEIDSLPLATDMRL
jgi:ComF family protein